MRSVTVPVLLLVVLGPAQAQVLPQRGSRVRVTSPVLKSGKEPGVVVAIRGDTMLLARDFPTGTVRIPVASVSTGNFPIGQSLAKSVR